MIADRHTAREMLYASLGKPETEKISVRESYGRVVAEELRTDRDYPDTRKSAVDGYAHIPGHDSYVLKGLTGAGRKGPESIDGKETVFVMTGATVPDGALCVARVEDCVGRDGVITIPDMSAGENINKVGEECYKGTVVATAGSVIHDGLFPVLFYLGKREIEVFRKPKIGIFVTGDEILEIEDDFKRGMVFNTNKYILESFFNRFGFDYEYYGHVKDNRDDVVRAFDEMSSKYDIIISSGGISMGKYDFVKDVFKTCDYEILFERTRIKPGSPLMLAKKSGCTFIGMPGYPAALTTNLLFYVLPALRKAYGEEDNEFKIVDVVMRTETRAKEGRFELNRAILDVEDGRFYASDAGTQKTSHYNSFASVNGLLLLDEKTGSLVKGDMAKALLVRV
ncbi:molybdenum cofactor synthesis domain protein [Denitrovibrio acetiphilus DSM 12809]|uniref:Molybdopterin molybdenumtransferase n=1 Tax=Denitrovibrio acetiphilus (strain DSM 12809 / NBRC 114555 / N2460) TaxID=522772 RepID=D4H0U6_DENA2|nr:molybdopterin molybdotransferase MoeA [Denitrovibrio acetiphilus]ADD68609.1 molybdenum cofactor synthesis domain protein [Denitrovibrio acetiphilus DSM 12809]